MEVSSPQKTFLSFLAPKKNSIKLFILTLDKTPLRETGCLNNLHYLLAAQASSLLIHYPF